MSDVPNPCPGLVFVDCEATGLEQPSHPLSVGLAWCDGRTELRLVRPHCSWATVKWNTAALRIHNLTPEMLEKDGHEACDVAAWLNDRCAGMTVCSDAPRFEAYWLSVLFKAAEITPGFRLADAEEEDIRAMEQAGGGRLDDGSMMEIYSRSVDRAALAFPHTHKADEDALHRAMIHREAVTQARAAATGPDPSGSVGAR